MRSDPKQGREADGKIGFAPGFWMLFRIETKMSGKTGWFCYAKKSGCDILDKKMKSKNVSLAVEIYPREGTETP